MRFGMRCHGCVVLGASDRSIEHAATVFPLAQGRHTEGTHGDGAGVEFAASALETRDETSA